MLMLIVEIQVVQQPVEKKLGCQQSGEHKYDDVQPMLTHSLPFWDFLSFEKPLERF